MTDLDAAGRRRGGWSIRELQHRFVVRVFTHLLRLHQGGGFSRAVPRTWSKGILPESRPLTHCCSTQPTAPGGSRTGQNTGHGRRHLAEARAQQASSQGILGMGLRRVLCRLSGLIRPQISQVCQDCCTLPGHLCSPGPQQITPAL